MRRLVFAAALLALRCAVDDASCAKGALGIEGGAAEGEGVAIAEVLPRGPADLAGIRRGDVIVSIDGERVRYGCQVPLQAFHRDCAPVSVIVMRGRERIETQITPVDEVPLYTAACAENDPTGCYRAAWLQEGSYEEACRLGSAAACAAHGAVLMQAGDAAAVDVLGRACDGGSGVACTHLGYLYVTGRLVPKNDIRSLDFYTRGCSHGDARGCYNVGILYDRGRGTSASASRAAAAYERACAAGVSMACTDVGWLYERGLGTMKDLPRAAEMYRLGCEGSACEPSNLRGCVNLGNVYRDGIGVPQDAARAAEIFREACGRRVDADDEKVRLRACVLLGAFEMNGLGVPQDVESGLARSTEGCTRGDAVGCFNLAVHHASRGELPRAAELFARSCDAGDGEACHELAALYDQARGVPYDPARSAALSRKACTLGHKPAC